MVGLPNNHGKTPIKNDHFGVFWGYHHLRKHSYVDFWIYPPHPVRVSTRIFNIFSRGSLFLQNKLRLLLRWGGRSKLIVCIHFDAFGLPIFVT